MNDLFVGIAIGFVVGMLITACVCGLIAGSRCDQCKYYG